VNNMKNRLLYLALLLSPMLASAQVSGPGFVNYVTSAPSGACSSNSQVQIVYGPGTIYACQSGTWANAGSGGTGTVTSVICGNGLTGGTITTTGTCAADLTVLAPLASPALTGNPTVPTQAATDNSTRASSTAYVTTAIANAVAGVNPAIAVNAATIQASDTSGFTYANGVAGIGATFTGAINTAVTIDGFTFTLVGQRLLVKNDTQSPSGAFNGIYSLTALQTAGTGAIFTRALDFDTPSDMNNVGTIPVTSGTTNATTQWLMTATIVTVGTTPLTFVQFSFAPGVNGTTTLYIAGGGSAQAQTATLSPALTANTTGVSFQFLPIAANTATAPTLAVNGLTAKTITKCGATALVANDLTTTSPAEVTYDGTEWVLQNPQAIGCAYQKITPSTDFYSPNQNWTTASSAVAQNTTKLWSVEVAHPVTTTKVEYNIVTTADNTGNLYDIGYYDASGNLVCHIGATAGTAFAPSAGVKSLSWAASCTLQAGRYYEALTTNASATPATPGGLGNVPTPQCNLNPATNNTTSGGLLNNTITFNADTWVTCTQPTFAATN
jgi:hypothetical protein